MLLVILILYFSRMFETRNLEFDFGKSTACGLPSIKYIAIGAAYLIKLPYQFYTSSSAHTNNFFCNLRFSTTKPQCC